LINYIEFKVSIPNNTTDHKSVQSKRSELQKYWNELQEWYKLNWKTCEVEPAETGFFIAIRLRQAQADRFLML